MMKQLYRLPTEPTGHVDERDLTYIVLMHPCHILRDKPKSHSVLATDTPGRDADNAFTCAYTHSLQVSTDARITCLCSGVYGSGKRGRKHSDKGGEGEGEDAGVAAGVSPQKADGDGSSVAKKKKKKKKSVAAS